MTKEFGSSASFNNFPIRQKGNLIGNFPGKTHFVRDKDKVAAFGTKLFDHFQDFGGHLRVKRRGGFVKKYELRADGNSSGNSDTLALTAGECGWLFAGMLFKLEPGEEIHGRFLCDGGPEPVDFFKRKRDVTQRGKMRKKVVRLENRADGAAVRPELVFFEMKQLSVDCDRARGGIL